MTLYEPGHPSEKADISSRAVRLGRIVDRMARGKYIIIIDVGAHEWTANVLSESTLSKIATVLDDQYRGSQPEPESTLDTKLEQM